MQYLSGRTKTEKLRSTEKLINQHHWIFNSAIHNKVPCMTSQQKGYMKQLIPDPLPKLVEKSSTHRFEVTVYDVLSL